MAQCITCGSELHPERAKKYNYCLAPECQEKNLKGLTMVAVGMNKAAEEYLILDERTAEELASGKYRDQRRGYFGRLDAPAAARPEAGAGPAAGQRRVAGRPRPRPVPAPARKSWTASQERLALLYNEQGLRPDEIAAKLGISARLATQIVLATKGRGRS